MTGYVKDFHSNKTMSFKASYNKLLKKYIKIWERVSNLMNIKFDSEPVYGDKGRYTKTKIKPYGDNVYTNFQGNKIPKENASCKCSSLIMLDSAIGVNKSYYFQTLVDERKYEITWNKGENLITHDLDWWAW